MLVNKTAHKFTGKLGQKVDKTKCGHNYKIILLLLWDQLMLCTRVGENYKNATFRAKFLPTQINFFWIDDFENSLNFIEADFSPTIQLFLIWYLVHCDNLVHNFQGNPVTVHVLQTLVLYECEKHSREEEWEEAHVGDRISGILMQLISCLQVKISKIEHPMRIYKNYVLTSIHEAKIWP